MFEVKEVTPVVKRKWQFTFDTQGMRTLMKMAEFCDVSSAPFNKDDREFVDLILGSVTEQLSVHPKSS